MVPSFVGLKRPDDSYKYYIRYTRAAKVTNQGFTIHHAAGGTLTLGLSVSWQEPYSGFFVSYRLLPLPARNPYREKILWFSFFAGTFILFHASFVPGPEGYKSIFMDSVPVLAIILLCGTFFQVRAQKIPNFRLFENGKNHQKNVRRV